MKRDYLPSIHHFRELHFLSDLLSQFIHWFLSFFKSASKSIWNSCPGKRGSAYLWELPSPARKHRSSLWDAHPLPGLQADATGAQSTRWQGTAGVHLPLPHHPSASTGNSSQNLPWWPGCELGHSTPHFLPSVFAGKSPTHTWKNLGTSWFCSFCSTRDFQWSHSKFRLVMKQRCRKHLTETILSSLIFHRTIFHRKNYVSLKTKVHLELLMLSSFCGNDNTQLCLSFLRITSLGAEMGNPWQLLCETDGMVADSKLGRTFISVKSCSILKAASLQQFQCLLVHTIKHKEANSKLQETSSQSQPWLLEIVMTLNQKTQAVSKQFKSNVVWKITIATKQ